MSKIILPNQDGVSSLEIRRMKAKLEGKKKPVEMLGHMSARDAKRTIGHLDRLKADIEAGKVRSCVLIWMNPDDQAGLPLVQCAFKVEEEDMGPFDQAFHVSWHKSSKPKPKPDPEDAG